MGNIFSLSDSFSNKTRITSIFEKKKNFKNTNHNNTLVPLYCDVSIPVQPLINIEQYISSDNQSSNLPNCILSPLLIESPDQIIPSSTSISSTC